MYIAIVGASKVGVTLAKQLIKDRHDVVIIEKDEEKAEKLASMLDIKVIIGDATESEILAEVREADVLVAATSSDATNFMIASLAKEMGIKRILALYTNPQHKELFSKVGIESIINFYEIAASYIKNLIYNPIARKIPLITDKFVLLEFKVENNFDKKKLKDIKLPENSWIIAIERKNDVLLPSNEFEIKKGDKLLILTDKETADNVLKKLEKT